MLDKNYKAPAGFEPVLSYPDEFAPGIPVVGLAKIKIGDKPFEFDLEKGVPVLPFKKHGELWHSGWDIPTKYVIDADGACWMDNAHGHPLKKASAECLIDTAEMEYQKNDLRRALGIDLPMPEWASIAFSQGFTAPEGWTWKKS